MSRASSSLTGSSSEPEVVVSASPSFCLYSAVAAAYNEKITSTIVASTLSTHAAHSQRVARS